MKPSSLQALILSFILAIVLSSCAVEEIPKYTLSTTVSPTEGGKIIASPQSLDYKAGDVVTLTAEPNEHWVFKQWEGDGSGSSTPLQITMTSDKSVVGVFVKRDYPLTLTIEGEGTVEEKIVNNPGGKVYPHGTTVELTPKPTNGWVFSSWGGDLTGSETPKMIIIDKEKKVTVKFIRNPIVTTLNCNAATNNGTLTSGVAVTGVVNIVIPYSGAFGGTHNGQTVTSAGVTGLTATLAAGTFAIGSGNLIYAITGTPSAVGIASFAINIGGKTCVLTRSLIAPQPSTTIVNVTNPKTGKNWIDRNLGASRVATSSTDIESYGDLYQWGRGTDGHQKRTSATTTTRSNTDVPGNGNFIITTNDPFDWRSPQNNNLWQGVNGINNPCPVGYRIPTEAEWNTERLSWISNNAAGAYASPLKLPMAGLRLLESGSIATDGGYGGYGRYWSSTISSANSIYLYFGSDYAGVDPTEAELRAFGFSVRCIKD
jgi:uncharacterized protein (TIGR02145 family)